MTARCDRCGEAADCVNERGRYLCVDCAFDEADLPIPAHKPDKERAA